MNITLKQKYIAGRPDDAHMKNKPWRGGRAGAAGSSNSGVSRSKGAHHPVGMSGRTAAKLVRSFRDHTSAKKK